MDLKSKKQLKVWIKGDAGIAQLVELQPSKLGVAGSNPVSRSKVSQRLTLVAYNF